MILNHKKSEHPCYAVLLWGLSGWLSEMTGINFRIVYCVGTI
jgi:hypothetical protein